MEIWIGIDSGLKGAACLLAGRQRPRVVTYNQDLGALICALSNALVSLRMQEGVGDSEVHCPGRPRAVYHETRVLIEPPHSRMRDQKERGPNLITSGRIWGHWEVALVSLGINQDHIRSIHPASWKTACGL